jgi:hypothetical protein
MSASLLAALRENARAQNQQWLKNQEDEVVSFEKLPELVRLEDIEVGVLLNK